MNLDDPGRSLAQFASSPMNTILSDAPSHRMESEDAAEIKNETENDFPKEAMCTRTTFFVNADWRLGSTLANATTIIGQMYVEKLDPVNRRHPYPIVLIHGDFHTSQLTKPDGRPGWASYFLNKGFQVYLVDMPPSGKSNYLTGSHFIHRDLGRISHSLAASAIERDLTAQAKKPIFGRNLTPLKHTRAAFHDKWPGTGQRGDPIFTNYCASVVALHLKRAERQVIGQNALHALLQRIGKAFLVGEGSGGNLCWLANDVAPDHVAGVVAVEPAGPPFGTALPKANKPLMYSQFIERDKEIRVYGLADIPLTYDPAIRVRGDLDHVEADPLNVVRTMRPDRLGACFLQQDELDVVEVEMDGQPVCQNVRQLIHLKKVPHALITAHASPHAVYDWATVCFMRQAGVDVEWLRLEDFGIFGNGHLMFLEVNSDEIAGHVERWIVKQEPPQGIYFTGGNDPITPPATVQ